MGGLSCSVHPESPALNNTKGKGARQLRQVHDSDLTVTVCGLAPLQGAGLHLLACSSLNHISILPTSPQYPPMEKATRRWPFQ